MISDSLPPRTARVVKPATKYVMCVAIVGLLCLNSACRDSKGAREFTSLRQSLISCASAEVELRGYHDDRLTTGKYDIVFREGITRDMLIPSAGPYAYSEKERPETAQELELDIRTSQGLTSYRLTLYNGNSMVFEGKGGTYIVVLENRQLERTVVEACIHAAKKQGHSGRIKGTL